ncbi:MAG: MFS transporter [Chloroflexi bacterium]|nr:MFS transporter [Chloroflexota bacterium]
MTNPQPVPAQEKSPVAPYAWVILAVVYFASVVVPFNQLKIPPIMPVLMRGLQINLTQAGLLMSIIAMIGMALSLPTGVILQRLGPKATLLISLSLMAAGAGIGAFATGFTVLLGSRVVEGLGMGLMGVAAPATIAMWFPPDKQGTPMGIWATWFPIGAVVIYNLAPMMASSLGWQSVWWAGAGFAVLMMVLSGLLVTRPPSSNQAGSQPQSAPRLGQALANRNIWLLALAFACMNFSMSALSTYYPTFLNEVRSYPLGQAAFISSIATLVILFSSPAAGWLSDRAGSRRLFFSLPFLALAALFALPFRVIGWQISALMIFQGLLLGAVPTATFAAAPEIMRKPEWAGLGLAVILLGQNFGQLLGPIFFSEMTGRLGWVTAGTLLIPFCLLGFVSGWMVKVK